MHGATELNAFGHAFRTTRNDATARLLCVQAAGQIIGCKLET